MSSPLLEQRPEADGSANQPRIFVTDQDVIDGRQTPQECTVPSLDAAPAVTLLRGRNVPIISADPHRTPRLGERSNRPATLYVPPLPEVHSHASVLYSADRPLTSTMIQQGPDKPLTLPVGVRAPKVADPPASNNDWTFPLHEDHQGKATGKYESGPRHGKSLSQSQPPYGTSSPCTSQPQPQEEKQSSQSTSTSSSFSWRETLQCGSADMSDGATLVGGPPMPPSRVAPALSPDDHPVPEGFEFTGIGAQFVGEPKFGPCYPTHALLRQV